jgi:DNA polymerase-3 subunit gamma/tau
VADLPSVEDLVRKLDKETPPSGGPGGGGPRAAPAVNTAVQSSAVTATHSSPSGPSASAGGAVLAVANDEALAHYPTFENIVELIRRHRDVKLLVEVETGVRLAAYQPGRIEFVPAKGAPHDLAQRLGSRLQAWTGNRWAVTLVNEGGGETIAEVRDIETNALRDKAQAHPLVQAVLMKFPGARITDIRTPKAREAEAELEALPEVDDEWDPFEDS